MINSRDKQIAAEQTIAKTSAPVREQIVCISDMISEGPIEGLVNGFSSVYLNDDSMSLPTGEGASAISDTTFTVVQGSRGATSNNTSQINYAEEGLRRKALLLNVWQVPVTKGTYDSGFVDTDNALILNFSGVEEAVSQMVVPSKENNLPNATLSYLKNNIRQKVSGYIVSRDGSEFSSWVKFVPESYSSISLLEAEESLRLDIHFNNTIVGWTDSNVTFIKNFPKSGTFKATTTGLYNVVGPTISNGTNFFEYTQKYEYSDLQFRTGELYQEPVEAKGIGVNSVQIPNSNFQALALEKIDALSEDPNAVAVAPPVIQGTSEAGYGLSSEQVSQCDEARLTFKYGSLLSRNKESGGEHETRVEYKISLTLIRGLTESTTVLVENRRHIGKTTSPVTFEEVINLEPFKPFDDFKITVERLTRHDGAGILFDGKDRTGHDLYATSVISSVNAVIKEPLSYPLTAYSHLTFSAKQFPNLPVRTYHVRGLKVFVPDNYTTREEAGSQDPADLYNGLWTTGEFREEKVYTNNPAWVFYDIVANNRYGLGDWISKEDIDIYALYRIAKYCDELVPDGKGGLEPRFTSNIYLTKQADAYKVLKDFATVFLGILYWSDGQMKAISDMPNTPIYNFSRSNVINGEFSYETTGSKTRVNQVIVVWNDPAMQYKQRSIIVEDKENIVKTGRLISQTSTAFGCTSEGQAIRYGRWKLWTAINQTEVVTFRTSVDSAFLLPGDIINIQNSAEYSIRFSGRVSSSVTPTTTFMAIDSPIVLTPGNAYKLNIVLEDTTSPNEGEEEDRPIKVETVDITGANYLNSTINFEALTVAPKPGAIWTITEEAETGTTASSSKEYRILSISEDSKSEFSITAAEYYSTKFDDITEEFSLTVPDTVYPVVPFDAQPPKVENIFVQMDSDYNKGGDEFIVSWELPETKIVSEIAEVLLYHTIAGYENPLRLSSSTTKFKFEGVGDSSYSIGVTCIGPTGNRSETVFTQFTVKDKFPSKVPRVAEGLPLGGTAGAALEISGTTLQFKRTAPGVSTIANPQDIFTTTVAGLDFSGLTNGSYEILFDRSAGSLIPLEYVSSETISYWKKSTNTNDFTVIAGTGTLSKTKLLGTNTTFTDLEAGQILKIGNNLAKIVFVESDTRVILDRLIEDTTENLVLRKLSFEPDFIQDTIVANLVKDTTSTFKSYMAVDSTIAPQALKTVAIYRKNDNTINTSSGTFDSPLTGNTDWSFSVPNLSADGDIVYVSTRTFSSDGLAPQDASWDTPVIYSQREDGSNIDIRIDSSEGTVFKNNSGSTTLKATALEDGLEMSDEAHNSMTYAWTDGQGNTLCVTSSREVIDNNGIPLLATGSTGSLTCSIGVPADSSEPACTHGSNLREIILGAEDVTEKQNINVIVGNIPE
jgi:predicted phage tail protein